MSVISKLCSSGTPSPIKDISTTQQQQQQKDAASAVDISSYKPPSRDITKYKFYDKLGEGSYGKVRLVQCTRTKKFYALKYMPIYQQASRIKTFTRERKVLAEINHPLICRLEAAFHNDIFLFLVLEHMECGDLRQYLQRYTFSEDAIRMIVAQITCALTYLHENGFVHRDVKPENILINSNGNAHLCDFNITTKLSVNNSVVHGFSGTFYYQAPEIHEHLPYTEQADWWALGCVLYEMVYGRIPFKARTSNGMVRLMGKGLALPTTYPPVSEACKEAILLFLKLTPCYRVKNSDEVFALDFFKGLSRTEIESDACDVGKKNPVLALYKIPQPTCVADTDSDIQELLEKEYLNWKKKKSKNQSNQQLAGKNRHPLPPANNAVAPPPYNSNSSKVNKKQVSPAVEDDGGISTNVVGIPADASGMSSTPALKIRYKDRLKLYGQIINRQLKKLAIGEEGGLSTNNRPKTLEYNGSSSNVNNVSAKEKDESLHDEENFLSSCRNHSSSTTKSHIYKDFDYVCSKPVLKTYKAKSTKINLNEGGTIQNGDYLGVDDVHNNNGTMTSSASGSMTATSTRADSGEMSMHKHTSGSLSSITSDEDYLPKGVIARGRAGKGSRVRIITDGKNREHLIDKGRRKADGVVELKSTMKKVTVHPQA